MHKSQNGVEHKEYYVLEYPDWVNVIAITESGDFVMERQYRHGLQWTGYEICAGVCESGESPLEAAQRELYEELMSREKVWSLLEHDEIRQALMAAPLWKLFVKKQWTKNI